MSSGDAMPARRAWVRRPPGQHGPGGGDEREVRKSLAAIAGSGPLELELASTTVGKRHTPNAIRTR